MSNALLGALDRVKSVALPSPVKLSLMVAVNPPKFNPVPTYGISYSYELIVSTRLTQASIELAVSD